MASSIQPAGEQMVDVGRGIELCAQSIGDPANPTVLLIAGLSQQLLSWPLDFCEGLVERGFHVVRFDNRDIGRSTHVKTPAPSPVQLVRRRFHPSQYKLGDMADDTAGLIDALGLGKVHAVGISMGGMIAQTLAAKYPDKVQSLVSIMSNVGSSKSGQPARSTLLRMAQRPSTSKDQSVKKTVALFRHIGSHGFPFDEAATRELASDSYDRGHDPRGPGRQLAAIMHSGNRKREVATITAPTLVLHGDRDRMVHPSGGLATAEVIPGAKFETIFGMGHDLPLGVRARLVTLIADHALASQEVTA